MSRDMLEKVLYDLSTSRQSKESFTADPDRFLGRYPLADDEKNLVRGYSVRALVDRGVNTMLTWGFWLQSGRSNADYLTAMRADRSGDR
jgi:hypothetical protein